MKTFKRDQEEGLVDAFKRLSGLSYPRMNEKQLHDFVSSCLGYKDVFMALVQKYGSPLYVIDESSIRERARRIKKVFEKHLGRVDVFFAMKSNNMPEISRIMVEEGIGIDVSSGLELAQACEVGATQIFFSGPGKTDVELNAAIGRSNRVTVLIDSFGELKRLDRLTRRFRRTIHSGVRLTTNPDGLWRKFGIPLDSLAQFIMDAHKTPFVKLEGLQFHTSWNLSPDAQTAFIEKLGSYLHGLPVGTVESIKFLDIGGGFWPEQGEWLRSEGTPSGKLKALLFPDQMDTTSKFCLESSPIDVFAESIARVVQMALPRPMDCRICIEPGRWLCNDAMHILISVVDIKDGNIAITDAGTNAIGWERFEQDFFPVINLTHPGTEEHQYDILGSLCTPHDIWGYSFHGTAIEPGDLLLIPIQGAYTYSLRQNFIKPLPRVVRLPRKYSGPQKWDNVLS